MNDINYRSVVNALSPVAEKHETAPLFYISGVKDNIVPEADNWCLECATKKLEELKRDHPAAAERGVVKPASSTEEYDGPPACTVCDQSLEFNYNESGALDDLRDLVLPQVRNVSGGISPYIAYLSGQILDRLNDEDLEESDQQLRTELARTVIARLAMTVIKTRAPATRRSPGL